MASTLETLPTVNSLTQAGAGLLIAVVGISLASLLIYVVAKITVHFLMKIR